MSIGNPQHGAIAPQHTTGRAFIYVAAAIAALGGLLFGYDTGVISGAALFLKNDFTLTTFELELIVSGVLVGAAAGALLGGRMADLFGRRKLLIVTAAIFAVGGIACAAAMSPALLVAGRIVVGFAIGLASGTVPVYISEVSPADARGWQVSLFQLAITVGILLAYVVDYAFAASQGLEVDVWPRCGARGYFRRGHVVPAGKPAVAGEERAKRKSTRHADADSRHVRHRC